MAKYNNKQSLLITLYECWIDHPDQRLGQLLYNLVKPMGSCPEIFYIEDKELYKLLRKEL